MQDFSFKVPKVGDSQNYSTNFSETRTEGFTSAEQAALTSGLAGTNKTQGMELSTPQQSDNRHKEVKSEHKWLLSSGGDNENVFGECPFGENEGFWRGNNDDAFNKINEKYKGKEITSENVNNYINEVLSLSTNNYAQLLNSEIFKLQEYLSPTTLNKFLNKMDYIVVEGGKWELSAHFDDVKNLYNKLNSKQKELYYEKLLKPESFVYESPAFGDSVGRSFEEFIFEKPLSPKTYNLLKTTLTELNGPNGIKNTRTASKDTISGLLKNGQITDIQAQELAKALGIKDF